MHQKWIDLARAMNRRGVYYGPPLRPIDLSKAFWAKRAVIRPRPHNDYYFAPGPIKAYVARRKSQHLLWQEISRAFVCEESENNGVMSDIVYELVARTPREIQLFSITKVIPTMKVFERCHLLPITKTVMPDVAKWAKCCGLGDRLPETALSTDVPNPIEGDRWLFIRG